MHGEMHGEMQWYRYSTTVLRYGGMHGGMQGKYYRYCSRSIRYSTDLNSENNKFDMETFDLVSEYCTPNTLLCMHSHICGIVHAIYLYILIALNSYYM